MLIMLRLFQIWRLYGPNPYKEYVLLSRAQYLFEKNNLIKFVEKLGYK